MYDILIGGPERICVQELLCRTFEVRDIHDTKHWNIDGERPRQMETDKCMVWVWSNECIYAIKYEN